MKTVKSLIVLAGSLLLLAPSTGYAVTSKAWVDDFAVSLCGNQSFAFSGTAEKISSEALLVKLDNAIINHTLSDINWMTGLTPVGVGAHTIRAEIVRTADNYIVDQHQRSFVVASCIVSPTPAPSNGGSDSASDAGGSSGGGGGGGDDGSNEPEPAVKKPKIKGAKFKGANCGISNQSVPAVVARHFSQVFGRSITHAESVYWKTRARGDKCHENDLAGAMRWHKQKGSAGPAISQNVVGINQSSGKVHPLQIKSLFRTVYNRNPSISENSYWLSRINDKPSVVAMLGAMKFHWAARVSH
jgi:hypothetical protein